MCTWLMDMAAGSGLHQDAVTLDLSPCMLPSVNLDGLKIPRCTPVSALIHAPVVHLVNAQVTLALSCILGLSINHSTFVCTRVNDPLTTSVAGSIKNIMMTLLGAVAFPDFRFRPSNAAGLGLSMAGAIYYATKTAQRVSYSLQLGKGGGLRAAYDLLVSAAPSVCGSMLTCKTASWSLSGQASAC